LVDGIHPAGFGVDEDVAADLVVVVLSFGVYWKCRVILPLVTSKAIALLV
jgi:hypothetical protein